MSAKARRQKRELERLTIKARHKIRELDHVILAAQRVATSMWWGGKLEEDARRHFDPNGDTSRIKLQTLVNMAGGDYVRFVVHYLLANERELALQLIAVVNFDPNLVREYEEIVGGTPEQLEENIQKIEERLTSIGLDVPAERERLLTKLAAGRRSA